MNGITRCNSAQQSKNYYYQTPEFSNYFAVIFIIFAPKKILFQHFERDVLNCKIIHSNQLRFHTISHTSTTKQSGHQHYKQSVNRSMA